MSTKVIAVFNFDYEFPIFDVDNVLYLHDDGTVRCNPIDGGSNPEIVNASVGISETGRRAVWADNAVYAASAIRRFAERGFFDGLPRNRIEGTVNSEWRIRRTTVSIGTKSFYIEQMAYNPPYGQLVEWPSVYHVTPR